MSSLKFASTDGYQELLESASIQGGGLSYRYFARGVKSGGLWPGGGLCPTVHTTRNERSHLGASIVPRRAMRKTEIDKLTCPQSSSPAPKRMHQIQWSMSRLAVENAMLPNWIMIICITRQHLISHTGTCWLLYIRLRICAHLSTRRQRASLSAAGKSSSTVGGQPMFRRTTSVIIGRN